jgi:hypothetical protein
MLAEDDNLLAAVDKVLESHFDKRIRLEHQLNCKSVAINFLVSLLEGRSSDLYVHSVLASEFQPEILKYVRDSVSVYRKEHEELKKKKKKLSKLALMNLSSDDVIMEISLTIMSAVSTLMLELRYFVCCSIFL